MRVCVRSTGRRCCGLKVVRLDEFGSDVGIGSGIPHNRRSIRPAVDDESVSVLLCVVLQEGLKLLCHGLEGLLRGTVGIAFIVIGLTL